MLSDNSLFHEPLFNTWKTTGRGFVSDEASPTLVQPGTYSVSLTVFNALNCSDQLVQNNRILVHPKPRAGFDVYPLARQTDDELKFVHTGSGASLYHWDMNDGNLLSSSEQTLLYTYKDSGFYTVKQIVENDQGCSDTAEYGDYHTGPRVITSETKAEMKRVLEDIQAGRFVQRFMLDNAVGNPEMKAARKRQAEHPIEQTGAQLRAMMPWISANKLVDQEKN